MKALSQALAKNPIFYVSRDVERAIGLTNNLPGYYIISNYSSFAKRCADHNQNIFLTKNKRILDSWELLENVAVKNFIKQHQTVKTRPRILVFKNTFQIEKICAQNNWILLNPPALLSGQIEEKISQAKWLGKLKKYFPPFKIQECAQIKFTGRPFILQFNRSHTGSGTILITGRKQLDLIKQKFPLRPAKTAQYIHGPLFTNNIAVWDGHLLSGNISYQITGLKPFTDNKFATIGNDWKLPAKILTSAQIKQYHKIVQAVGRRMIASGWRGLFGIDVVADARSGRLYLVEINARQPASASYESSLQSNKLNSSTNLPDKKSVWTKNDFCSIFQAHLAGLLKLRYNNCRIVKINSGAQIVRRITADRRKIKSKAIIQRRDLDLNIIKYDNNKPGADNLRIQTNEALMQLHNKFNQLGKQIINLLSDIK